jgi:hypothetical protein
VRLKLRTTICLLFVLGLATAFGKPAAAGPDQELLPEQSGAKAKAVLQQVITALGGRAFLEVRDVDCTGRLAQFGHNNDLTGFTPVHDLWILPDKNRTEFISKGENSLAGYLLGIYGDLSVAHGGILVTVFNGDQGWILDKAGVSDQPEEAVKGFAEQVKSGMYNVLRSRMNEPGVELRYSGTDLVDLKEVEWIDISDRDHREFRLAADKSTHLPLRWVVEKRDPETHERSEIITNYAQFIPIGGVQTPLNVSRIQGGRQVSQVYFAGCKYNANLSQQLFTSASLEQKFGEVGKKNPKK